MHKGRSGTLRSKLPLRSVAVGGQDAEGLCGAREARTGYQLVQGAAVQRLGAEKHELVVRVVIGLKRETLAV